MKPCRLFDFSSKILPYESVWRWQKLIAERIYLRKKIGQKCADELILAQHCSVYTLGKGGKLDNIMFDKGETLKNSDVFRVERGGEVTWHGPGQLVAYPILDLNNHKKDLHWLVRTLEHAVIKVLRRFDIKADRSVINPGVWVGNNKISAIGISASRWITMHGISLNVDCDMNHYQHIIPCGIADKKYGVCSIKEFVPAITIQEVSQSLINTLSDEFQLEYSNSDLVDLDDLLKSHPDIAMLQLDRVMLS